MRSSTAAISRPAPTTMSHRRSRAEAELNLTRSKGSTGGAVDPLAARVREPDGHINHAAAPRRRLDRADRLKDLPRRRVPDDHVRLEALYARGARAIRQSPQHSRTKAAVLPFVGDDHGGSG